MYSNKGNVLQLVALLKAYNIDQIILSPGSRNSPLIHTFSQDSFFNCQVILDERNAAFYAIGIMQCTQKPVAICCTSGTALLNYAPAVAEAFYQELPLIVISADRSIEWIGQMDGQTIPQINIFSSIVKKSVNLPEIKNKTDEWFCNRLINEALISCINSNKPVHINIPISEPLFDYSEKELPKTRVINSAIIHKSLDIYPYVNKWKSLPKRMIIVGQLPKSKKITHLLEQLVEKGDCAILAEHLSNCASADLISNFDVILSTVNDDIQSYSPDLLITFGGHIVSKRIKQFIRNNRPSAHWHISESDELVDLYQSLTDLVEIDPYIFLCELLEKLPAQKEKKYFELWKNLSSKIKEPSDNICFSDIWATGKFLEKLPHYSMLHLANSSTVRNAQLFKIKDSISIFCNRGTNGIESSLPSAIGFASVYEKLTYLIIGDLSFLYTLSSLWNIKQIKNLRILLINNQGGGIFHLLPGQEKSPSLAKYIAAGHDNNASKWIEAAGLNYLSANNKDEFIKHLNNFFDNSNESIVLEVNIDIENSKQSFKEYYQQLKNKV